MPEGVRGSNAIRVIGVRIVQFCAIILTAFALVPSAAHVLELPHKIQLNQADYLTVQGIYRGWALLGIVWIAALAAAILLAVVSRHQRPPWLLAASAAALLGISLAVFFIWTFPVNQATSNWTVAPLDWAALRDKWEYSHAANAALTFLAFCATVTSSLAWRP